VTATDRVGSFDSAEITIHERLTVAPRTVSVPTSNDRVELAVEITGGIGDVTVLSNTLEANTAVIHDRVLFYTPAEIGKDHIELSDEYGSISVVTVTVYEPGTISIDPTSAIVVAGDAVDFTVHFSAGELSVSLDDDSAGSIETAGTTVTFTASGHLSEITEVTITATTNDEASSATVYVVIGEYPGPLTVTPSNAELNTEGRVTLTVSGGIVPYSFELASGGGELIEDPDGITAVFTAAGQPGTTRVRVYDRTRNYVVAQIKVKRN
ncbi:MAG: hypothetical protein EA426_19885, partial [Spirochaetaceae bacterium]